MRVRPRRRLDLRAASVRLRGPGDRGRRHHRARHHRDHDWRCEVSTAPLLDDAAAVATPSSSVDLVPTQTVSMFERLAKDPSVDVSKLERLIELQKDVLRVQAKAAFDAAFSRMQAVLPEVDEKGAIKDKNGGVRSRYARLEDIHHAVKPILRDHGFAIRHRTEWPEGQKGVIRVVGILSHEQGHSEESIFEAPMDRSDFRTDIQSMGSTISYGRRYTTIDLLNITTRGLDDDGGKAGRPQPPAGYEAWLATLDGIASDGSKAFDAAWQQSKPEFKTFLVNHDKQANTDLKAKAAKKR